jgi:hypothetical protein
MKSVFASLGSFERRNKLKLEHTISEVVYIDRDMTPYSPVDVNIFRIEE